MSFQTLLTEAQELEQKLLGFVFQERSEDDKLDWDKVNELLKERDKLHRQLAGDGQMPNEVAEFLKQAHENTRILLKLAEEFQNATQKELIKIEKGRKANQAYY